MVIGNGDLASVLPDKEDLLYFASGVSNSAETRKSEFDRESNLLLEQKDSRRVIYFSSLATLEKNTPYYMHKRKMEQLVKRFTRYCIVRLGNITWGNNPNTLINSLKNRIESGEEIIIKNEYRYLVDKEEFLYWINKIPVWNYEMNIPGRRMKITQVLKEYVL